MELTRSYKFSASHQMKNPELSEKENADLYGHCARDHGHSYQMEVTVNGTPDPKTGMILNAEELDRIVDRAIIQSWDHRHLNHEVEEFKGMPVSSEAMLVAAWKRLLPNMNSFKLSKVRLVQTPNTAFEFRGEGL